MIIKNAVNAFLFTMGLGIIACTFAQTTPPVVPPIDTAEFSPKSGNLLDSQKFDLILLLPGNILPIVNAKASLDNLDISGWFQQCFQPQKLADGSISLACSSQSGSTFGVGPHRLDADIFFADGSSRHASADYNVISTTKINFLPYTFLLPSSIPNYGSGIFVAAGDRVKIIANGHIITWAANPNFPIATPRGSVSCNSIECLVPGAMTGALLVKIGPTGRWLVAADFYNLVADRPGELIFAVNDKNNIGSWADNIGSFEVTISR